MELAQCRLSTGARIPLLVTDDSPLPVLVPFMYVQLKLRHRAYNTAKAHLRTIRSFYAYGLSRALDVDETILAGRFETLLDLLDGFVVWIQNGRQTDTVAGVIGVHPTTLPTIASSTRDEYLRSLKRYLSWCATRYIPRVNGQSESGALRSLDTAFADVADAIERRFESHIINLRPDRGRYRSLTEAQVEIIRALINPRCSENPFVERLKLRNWLIIELLLETGMRRGELLKLYTTDINQGSQHAYVSIVDREGDPDDPRAEEPALKGHGRTIAVSQQLYEVYEQYIQQHRRPIRNGKPIRMPFRYLFISDRGRPLSIRALSSVFDKLLVTLSRSHPGLLNTLSPHDFRHTFADRFLAYLVDTRGYDLERASDELRRVCGWSEASTMPRRYASRYLAESANRHNAERLSAAGKRVKGANRG